MEIQRSTRSTKKYGEVRRSKRSTEKYEKVPKSTEKYRKVPGSTEVCFSPLGVYSTRSLLCKELAEVPGVARKNSILQGVGG